MNFGKYNKFKTIDWGMNTENFTYKKLSDYPENTIFQIKGFFVIKDNLNGGNQAVAILKDCFLNIPKHKVEVVTEIINDEDSVNAIKDGECYIQTYKYKSEKYNKECFDFNFVSADKVAEILETTKEIF